MKVLIVLAAFVAVTFAGRESDTTGQCASAPCQNDGRCKNGIFTDNYYCGCKFGFYGRNCEKKVMRKCDHEPCENGGTCVNRGWFHYYCKCNPGYTGKHCENTPCDSNPCLNGGQCENGQTDEGGYQCHCTDEFEGANCEMELPPPDHNCEDRNPCARSNTLAHGFYFAHADKTKFVQCSEWEQCFVMPCGPGTEWDQDITTCGWPK